MPSTEESTQKLPNFNDQLEEYKKKHGEIRRKENKGKPKYPRQKKPAKNQTPSNSGSVQHQSFFRYVLKSMVGIENGRNIYSLLKQTHLRR